MTIDGFSEKTAELLNEKFNTEKYSDLYKLNREEISKLEGYKDIR